MTKKEYSFSSKTVRFYFDASIVSIGQATGDKPVIILTDENVYENHRAQLDLYPVIRILPGEENKTPATAGQVIEQLITMGAGRDAMLVGVGGGVVTDIAGYVAAVYMRGISFGFVPTSILAMTDAAIGGKNGVDVGVYKNMVGTIRQPDFIFYDYSFLKTLPVSEWVNGFAEVIKHACIKDAVLFSMLERYTLHEYQSDPTLVAELIERNVDIKASVVSADEFETGDRKLLNFGHTIGHAIENLHHIPHGHAVSIGMVAACNLSEQLGHLHFEEAARIVRLLARYHLPVDVDTDHARVFEVLKMDKKRKDDAMQFILLNKIGSASVVSIPLAELEKHFKEIL
ncbi:MAG TPA: 3-dehydroquinate synthase [Ferruginibacter sp.]|nr:3-dehydroquinate synthase [Ferruginibacter sp.]HNL64024.1 3-dehydroquinate synthase [Ferruginibacter sp.]HNO98910.1 3-dehydroquinate synthase [Ferruginibacter sp.]